MIKNQNCSKCQCFLPDEKKPEQGQCRAEPPQLVQIQVMEKKTVKVYPNNPKNFQTNDLIVPTTKVRSMFPPVLGNDPGCMKFSHGSEKG